MSASTSPQLSLLAAETHSLASTDPPQADGVAWMHELVTILSQSGLGVPPQACARAHHAFAASAQSAFPPHPAVASVKKQDNRISAFIGFLQGDGG